MDSVSSARKISRRKTPFEDICGRRLGGVVGGVCSGCLVSLNDVDVIFEFCAGIYNVANLKLFKHMVVHFFYLYLEFCS